MIGLCLNILLLLAYFSWWPSAGVEINLLKSFSLRLYERSPQLLWRRISLRPKLVSTKLIAPTPVVDFDPIRWLVVFAIIFTSFLFYLLGGGGAVFYSFMLCSVVFFKSVSLMRTIYKVGDHVSQVIPLVSLQPTPLLTNLSFSLTNNLNLHTRNYNINFRHCNNMKSDMTSLEPFC